MKKILVYSWGGFTDSQLLKVLEELNVDYTVYEGKMTDYHADMAAAAEIIGLLHSSKAEAIFSYNYFPLLSSIAQMNRIPYISWVFDCPHYTLLSETLTNEWNYIFCFDAAFTRELENKGAVHAYHFPLGVAVADMEERIAAAEKEGKADFVCDVAFVGSFYNNQENRIRHASFSEHTRGYLDGMIEAQMLVYGAHFVGQVLCGEALEELVETCELRLGAGYRYESIDLAAGIVDKEITARERERILAAVAERHRIHVYTGSKIPEKINRLPGFIHKGFADTQTQMPAIFKQSRINLNITLKSITTGIPQRVLDILACGGFCLTNYQPEIAAFFEDGVEVVMYSGIADLCRKIDYYLAHEEERAAIAERGKEKVKELFDLSLRVGQMLKMVNK